MAVFQVSRVLGLFHKVKFYRELSRDPERIREIKQKLTLDSLERAIADIEELKGINAELRERVQELES